MKRAVSLVMVIAWIAALALAQEKSQSPTPEKPSAPKSESVGSMPCCGSGMASAKKATPKESPACKGSTSCCKQEKESCRQEKECCKETRACTRKAGETGGGPEKASGKKS
jgi:hypothetical protein